MNLQIHTGETARFYQSLLTPGLTGIIAGNSGTFKTGFLCNLCAYAINIGKRVLFVCMDTTGPEIIRARLYSINNNKTYDDISVNGDWPGMVLLDYTTTGASAEQLKLDIANQLDAFDLIIIDGVDTAKGNNYLPQNIETAIDEISRLNCGPNKPAIWTTSQCTRNVDDKEIVTIDDLAFTAEKARRVSLVLALGIRERDRLWTVGILKDRNNLLSNDRQLFRFALQASLRFKIVTTKIPGLPHKSYDTPNAEFEFLGPETELPRAETIDPDAGYEAEFTGRQLWHSDNGFVSIGRKFFRTAMFQSRNLQYCYWMLDLYEKAHHLPDPNFLQAPGTSIPVQVNRGELMSSLTTLASAWNCSDKRVRTFLKRALQNGAIKLYRIGVKGKRKEVLPNEEGIPKEAKKRQVANIIKLIHYRGIPKAGEKNGQNDGQIKGH